MILLDAHMWIWWVSDSSEILEKHKNLIQSHISDGLGLSMIS